MKRLLLVLLLTASAASYAQDDAALMSLSMKDVQLAEVMAMLAKQERVNILLGEGVEGEVSFSLYDVTLEKAIRAISNSAGFGVEYHDGNYMIVDPEEAGRYVPDGMTQLRTYQLEYADIDGIETVLTPYLSPYGKLTVFLDRRLIMVEDTPMYLDRLGNLLDRLDDKPKQILIEARILEITLSDEESYGIDWVKLFESDGGNGTFGSRGLADTGDSGNSGFFFDYLTPNFDVALSALDENGRVRTLSTPKLLALENEEASVIIGDRRGFTVTTTINQVTTETVEFLESGVILRVTPSVDAKGRVMMDIHPEVSTGSIDPNTGIPSQTTTEVTTQMIVGDGDTIFIGGLMKHTLDESSQGVPVLGKVPVIRRLFSNQKRTNLRTETVVLITPKIVDQNYQPQTVEPLRRIDRLDQLQQQEVEEIRLELDRVFERKQSSSNEARTPNSEQALSLRLSPRLNSESTLSGS